MRIIGLRFIGTTDYSRCRYACMVFANRTCRVGADLLYIIDETEVMWAVV